MPTKESNSNEKLFSSNSKFNNIRRWQCPLRNLAQTAMSSKPCATEIHLVKERGQLLLRPKQHRKKRFIIIYPIQHSAYPS